MTIATPTYLAEIAHTAGTNVTSKATGAFTPSANALLIVTASIAGVGGTIDVTSVTDTFTGSGSWSIDVEQTADDVNNNCLLIATCQMGATPGSGAVTVNITPASGRWAIQVHEVASGYNTSAPVTQAKASSNTGGSVPDTISDTMTSATAAGSLTFAACHCLFSSGETVLDLTPGAWADAELRETNSTLAISCSLSSAYDAGGSQSASWSNLENNDNIIGIIEIAEARAIAITTPANAGMFFQRDGNDQADIAIAGTYTGSPTAIEADFGGGGYATIDAAPAGGTFSGTLSAQAAGQGTLTVRFTNDTNQSDTVANVAITDVFVIAGQSNANGYAQNNDTPAASGNPYIYNITAADSSPYTAGAIVALADPTNNESGEAHGSHWPRFAELFYAEHGFPPGLIMCARGSTGMVGPTSHWAKAGDATYYDRMITRLSALATLGLNDVKAILWNQGGADVNDGTTKAAYKTALSLMLDDVQTDCSFFDSPSSIVMVCGAFENWVNATGGGDNTGIPADDNMDAIRFAHIELWTEDADIYPGEVGHTRQFGTGAGPGGVHWYTDAERDLHGALLWRAVAADFYGSSEAARGPQVSTVEIATDVVTVTFAGGVSPLQNATTVQGWEVKDDGTPVTINTAALNGTMAVDLTLASTPSGVVTVSWAHGNDAEGNPLVDSGAIATMPPEPFVDRGLTVTSTGRRRPPPIGPFRWWG